MVLSAALLWVTWLSLQRPGGRQQHHKHQPHQYSYVKHIPPVLLASRQGFGGSSSIVIRIQNLSHYLQSSDDNDISIDDPDVDDDNTSLSFRKQLDELVGISKDSCEAIVKKLIEVDLLMVQQKDDDDKAEMEEHRSSRKHDDAVDDAETLLLLAQDFVDRPEVFSTILISDFGISPLLAHQIRAAVMIQLKRRRRSKRRSIESTSSTTITEFTANSPPAVGSKPSTNTLSTKHQTALKNLNDFSVATNNQKQKGKQEHHDNNSKKVAKIKKRPSYKSVIVNKQAKLRKAGNKQSSSSSEVAGGGAGESTDYGLPKDYQTKFPALSLELDDFYAFMTRPSTISQQETPIREATATVYLRHATLFLGWYYHANANNDSNNATTATTIENQTFSLYNVFPTKEKESAQPIIDFVLWLRSSRKISVSYEANLLRGLTKLLKFRFAKESTNDPSYGEKSFDDIPLIREIRMLHRDANKRQRLAPRSSDEKQKWLSWPEYLQVVSLIQEELATMIREFNKNYSSNNNARSSSKSIVQRKKIATLFQKYLVLAIFASIPDRQRTIRELVVGGNFQKDDNNGGWCIRHAPEEYKTGKAYGERPPLQLAETLTPEIDEFLERWRGCLSPVSEALFVQPRTGKPLTQDSVYQIVSRCCYKYMGKRTNPHLLRDMLVTHVRESSNASEKQLEALALYMGHSINMQRTSYDRRTLTKKVAPAVELMQHVNSETNPSQ